MNTMSFQPRTPQRLEFGDELGGGFGARHAAVHDDDVAEFAVEWAAARELHGHGDVVP